jgi:hypothetical protein
MPAIPAAGPRIPIPPPPAPPSTRPPPASIELATVIERPSRLGSASASADPEELDEPEAISAELSEAGSEPVTPGPQALSSDLSPDEVHVREVFAEYVAARRQCGEPTASLTLDKFRAKLDANREQLIAKYACRTARFSVYIKDGKASIKATPVRG